MDNRSQSDTILRNVEEITALQELHKSARVISINGWVALVFVAALFCGILIWSFVGRLPVTVNGKGILLQDQAILGFFSLYSGQQIKAGMHATVSLDSVDSSRYGRIEGIVRHVPTYPVSADDLQQVPSRSLREFLTGGKLPTIMVEIEPIRNDQGLQWTSKKGPSGKLLEGSVGEVEVTLQIIKPIHYVIPKA
ncbi:MAG TPA: hypothetical protein VLE96_07575 [Chlamydiales bacterium]|nr:hypothetical protein [Chlamydiales bacterium]